MKHKIKVVMLPTEDAGPLYYTELTDRRKYQFPGDFRIKVRQDYLLMGYKPQHLYITVNYSVETIGDGEWYYSRVLNDVFKNEGKAKIERTDNRYRKIIATTDPKLTKSSNWIEVDVQGHWECTNCGGWTELIENRTCKCNPIPQLQQSFLKEYVANPDGEWEVEYDCLTSTRGGILDLSKNPCWEQITPSKCMEWKLKLNKDNTINITSVEEKMYSRDEVDALIEYVRYNFAYATRKSILARKNKWIKKNL